MMQTRLASLIFLLVFCPLASYAQQPSILERLDKLEKELQQIKQENVTLKEQIAIVKKMEGPRGPQGERGPQGLTGVQGPPCQCSIVSGQIRIPSHSSVEMLFTGGNEAANIYAEGDLHLGSNSTYRISILKDGRVVVNGPLTAKQFITGDIVFQKDGQELWKMFEDESGLYLQNVKSGQVYTFVLQEVQK